MSPEDFGARGDGASDDTAAFTEAFAKSLRIELRPGATYRVSSVVVPAGRAVAGNGATIQQIPAASGDGSPMLRIIGSGVTIGDVEFDGSRRSHPQDGFSDSFDGGRRKTGRGYRAAISADGRTDTVSRLRVVRCRFRNVYGACIALRDVSEIEVGACEAADCNFELLFTSATRPTRSFSVHDCTMRRLGTGDALVNGNGIVVSYGEDVRIERNTFEDLERNGIKLEQTTRNATIAMNRMDGNRAPDFAFLQIQALANNEATHISVVSNRVMHVGAGVAFNTRRVTAVLIEDNDLIELHGPAQGDGLQLANGEISDVTIRNNRIERASRDGILLGSSAGGNVVRDVTIEGNRISTAKDARAGASVAIRLIDARSTRIRVASNELFSGPGARSIDLCVAPGAETAVSFQGNRHDGEPLDVAPARKCPVA